MKTLRLLFVLVFSSLGLHAHAQTITEIIDAAGDGAANTLNSPWPVAVDGSGNVYVAG